MPNTTKTHSHHPSSASDSDIQCVNDLDANKLSTAHRLADKTVEWIGSWKFLVIQTVILIFWTAINILAWFEHWDPYPFILMNLFLAIQAAYTGPVIMMSQNRQAARDRIEAHNDYLINIKAEKEICGLEKRLIAQSHAINELKELIQQKLN